MEKVLIVAKTRMQNNICVSGLTHSSNEGIRLLTHDGSRQPLNTPFEVGDVWEIEYEKEANVTPPHVENVRVYNERRIGKVTRMRDTLLKRVQPWRGGIESLFDGMLTIDQHSCYIAKSGPIPQYSTGYWLPNKPLWFAEQYNNKPYYHIEHEDPFRGKWTISIRFVGLAQPLPTIMPETLVRVSLARWWDPNGGSNVRCYLQLSGWYQ